MQWNTDANGNPISVHKQEMQQVSPVHFNIQLDEIPDRYHRLSVKDTDESIYHEVDDFSRITEQSYYVDYNNGVVYFHQSKGATVVEVVYYGRGFKLIHSSRIAMEDGARLTDVLSNVQELGQARSMDNNTQEQLDKLHELVKEQQKQIDELTHAIKGLTIGFK